MKLDSASFGNNQRIPGAYAFAVPHATDHITLSTNRNPQLAWSGAPAGTKSFVLICHDYDVPSKGDDVNKEGRSVPASLPRVDFYHWLLVDIPANMSAIAEAEFSDGVSARGKPGPEAKYGARQGLNDYTGWFAGDKDMGGDYFGYDGPCPPWNDEIVHHYVFTLYALDSARCAVSGAFKGAEVLKAIEGHVLAEASLTGTYTLNPKLA
ncbi:MAG TPA: YbhB/YbcL family Raf kinase inhibitor-like protein [Burkholderiales bacterium]|nr:YbhB/YbcL family Raf kinase inhibitor-like protein [Burkholderiales bacterium]